ncbi:MAG: hypothetical protein ACI9LM_005113 [Alteromonadaceae bacterium]|jgi:hypothetical protein
MKNNLMKIFTILAMVFVFNNNANAHTVSLSWEVLSNGDVKFYDQHWHGVTNTPAGSLFVDGTEYAFTSVLNGVDSISGLAGALVDSTYATFAGDTLTTLSNNNFLTVIISGITAGTHTFGTTDIALTRWTMPSNGGQIEVNIPSVPEPSTIILLALALVLLVKRNKIFSVRNNTSALTQA